VKEKNESIGRGKPSFESEKVRYHFQSEAGQREKGIMRGSLEVALRKKRRGGKLSKEEANCVTKGGARLLYVPAKKKR